MSSAIHGRALIINNMKIEGHTEDRHGANFTNILLAQLRQYCCANKKFNLHCKHKKASRKTFVQKKARVKCW
jgi:hypothetical protein